MDECIAENQRLSNLVAQANGSLSRRNEQLKAPSATDERAKELLRLRGAVEALRQQSKEIETLREDTVVVTAAFEDRTDTHTVKLLMKKIGNDWKLSGLAE
jgi:hypothetical protein